jgi:hypothetical protein
MRFGIALLACLFSIRPAFACSQAANSVLRSMESAIHTSLDAKGKALFVDFDYVSAACKAWPQKSGYEIVARPYVYMLNAASEHYLGMDIAVINEKTGTVLATADPQQTMVVDALTPSEKTIDAANYEVKKGVVAFGVRTTRRNNSDVVPIQESVLNMYVIDRDKIARIAGPLVVSAFRGEAGGDCTFSASQDITVISIPGTKTNDYFDMLAKVKRTKSKEVKNRSGCKKVEEPTKVVDYRLKFNGTTYDIPATLQASVN